MGRRRLTLIERVMDGSFRPRHHASLLAGDLLPARPPEGVPKRAAEAWKALRFAQLDYHGASSEIEERAAAFAFQKATDEFRAARSRSLSLRQLLYVTIGPFERPYSVALSDAQEWEDAKAAFDQWETTYGPAWRVRSGYGIDGDVDELPVHTEIPDPPGLDLLG
jgi:hypothetical protein